MIHPVIIARQFRTTAERARFGFIPTIYNRIRTYDYKLPYSITFATIHVNKLMFRNYEPIYVPAFIITMHIKL